MQAARPLRSRRRYAPFVESPRTAHSCKKAGHMTLCHAWNVQLVTLFTAAYAVHPQQRTALHKTSCTQLSSARSLHRD